jgi:hypothetical protein
MGKYGVKLSAYMRRILTERSIPGNTPPSPQDIEVFREALEGLGTAEIKKKTGIDITDILAGIKRTRDHLRRGGDGLTDLCSSYPKVAAWQKKKFGTGLNPKDEPAPAPAPAPAASREILREASERSIFDALRKSQVEVTPAMVRRIEQILKNDYSKPDYKAPKTVSEFLAEVRTEMLKVVAPLVGRNLALQLASLPLDPHTLKVGIDAVGFTTRAKAPLIAAQFNFGAQDEERAKRIRGGMTFEKVLEEARKTEELEVSAPGSSYETAS